MVLNADDCSFDSYKKEKRRPRLDHSRPQLWSSCDYQEEKTQDASFPVWRTDLYDLKTPIKAADRPNVLLTDWGLLSTDCFGGQSSFTTIQPNPISIQSNPNPIQIQSKSNPIQANTTQHDLLMQMIMIVSALIQVLQTKLIAEWFKMIWRFTKRFEMI